MSVLCQANSNWVTNQPDDALPSERRQASLVGGRVLLHKCRVFWRGEEKKQRIPAEEPHPTEAERNFPLMADK